MEASSSFSSYFFARFSTERHSGSRQRQYCKQRGTSVPPRIKCKCLCGGLREGLEQRKEKNRRGLKRT